MKKISFTIIFLAILVLIPIVCNADYSIPTVTPYEVRVSNVNGTNLITYTDDTTVKVPYDTILKVYTEIRIKDTIYGAVAYNDNSYYVKLSDVETLENEMLDVTKIETAYARERTLYVYEEGAYLYKGPSKLYGRVDGDIMLPVGMTVTFDYTDEMWGYIEYNGVKGWVYIYQTLDLCPYEEGSCLVDIKEGSYKYYTLKDIYLTKTPRTEEKNGVVIPAFSEITYKYYYNSHIHKMSWCIEYEGKEGWYERDKYDVAYDYSGENWTLTAVEDLPVYSTCGGTEIEPFATIPENTECDLIYYYDSGYCENWSYISYNGIEGWVMSNDYGSYKINYLDSNEYGEQHGTINDEIDIEYTDTNETEIVSPINSFRQSIIYCIAFAVEMVFIAILLIMAINRRKA